VMVEDAFGAGEGPDHEGTVRQVRPPEAAASPSPKSHAKEAKLRHSDQAHPVAQRKPRRGVSFAEGAEIAGLADSEYDRRPEMSRETAWELAHEAREGRQASTWGESSTDEVPPVWAQLQPLHRPTPVSTAAATALFRKQRNSAPGQLWPDHHAPEPDLPRSNARSRTDDPLSPEAWWDSMDRVSRRSVMKEVAARRPLPRELPTEHGELTVHTGIHLHSPRSKLACGDSGIEANRRSTKVHGGPTADPNAPPSQDDRASPWLDLKWLREFFVRLDSEGRGRIRRSMLVGCLQPRSGREASRLRVTANFLKLPVGSRRYSRLLEMLQALETSSKTDYVRWPEFARHFGHQNRHEIFANFAA